jgi:hypothetical protein
MNYVQNFEGFLNEASAFNTDTLKNSNFILRPFDAPHTDCFQFTFNKDINKAAVEKAIAAEKGAKGTKYEWKTEGGKEQLIITPGKNCVGLSWIFKAVDEFVGLHGESMGWCL